MLEHDPNSSRRKIRRTEDIADSGLGEDGSGNGASEEDSESLARIPSAAPHTPPPETVGQVQDSHKLEQRSQAGALPSAEFDGNPATLDGTLKKSPQRKTLKLNANGRLLSSPTLSGVEDKSRQKGKGRPKKSGNRKTKEDGKALVVMKYASEGGHGERIGSLIDDIISGRKKHGVPERPVIPTSTASQPPKPTHPFFWKKPTHKPDIPSQATQTCQDAKIIEPSGEDAPKSPPAARDKPCDRGRSFPSFKQRPKFPEPIDPVWPPRDLVHVRGFGAADERHAVRDLLGMDQKKAKMAAIRVGDQENVLRSTTTEAQRSESFQVDSILRIPGRQVASGRVLQKAVSKQLSRSASVTGTDNEAPSEHCHPAIRKLSSSIPTSMTAFDRGELEHLLWAHKYMPTSAEEVLQTGR
jgi:sorting nexin-8